VDIKLSGNAVNGGTIAGRDIVKIDAATRLSLQAGRDIQVASTTTQGGSTAASGVKVQIQGIDRIAGLYVSEPGGTLSLKADQDVMLQGAQVRSNGSVDIEAGRDILLGAVTTGEQLDARWNKDNTRQSSVTQSTGTTISAEGGNATLYAGRDLKAEAAKLSASDTLKLEARGAIEADTRDFEAGKAVAVRKASAASGCEGVFPAKAASMPNGKFAKCWWIQANNSL